MNIANTQQQSVTVTHIAREVGRKLGTKLARGWSQFQFWQERSRTRAQMNDLLDWQLQDLGLSREQVLEESRKAFWQD